MIGCGTLRQSTGQVVIGQFTLDDDVAQNLLRRFVILFLPARVEDHYPFLLLRRKRDNFVLQPISKWLFT